MLHSYLSELREFKGGLAPCAPRGVLGASCLGRLGDLANPGTLWLGLLAGLEGDGTERASVVGLLQDGRHGQLRGVGEQARRPRRVPHEQHRGRRQRSFERVGALLRSRPPRKLSPRAAGCRGP